MPRRGYVKKRKIPPDPVYNSEVVQRFINKIMRRGKKTLAERICYGAFKIIEEKMKKPALEVFFQALENTKPVLEVKSRRIGGATYQVPVEVREDRREALAMRWIIQFAKQRSGKTMQEKLANEIIDAYNNTGASIKKKEDTHKMAEANRAFAHYRW
jgi:small subunit ribosomal protein S7